MSDKRNLFHLQMAAKLHRANTEGQLKLRDALQAAGYDDSTILIQLERYNYPKLNQSREQYG